MVSVVIPLYNKEQDIKYTLNSVINQSFRDFEIVVVNDGSTDDSLQIVKSLGDTRINIISKENEGVSSARNRGIKEAKYKWVALLDGDDIWEINHLEALLQAIDKFPEKKFFATNLQENGHNQRIDTINFFVLDDFYSSYLSMKTIVNSSTTLIHKSVFEKVGGFNEVLVRGEDIDMWDRIAQEYQMVKVDLATVYYRLDASNRAMNKQVPLNKCFVEVIPAKAVEVKTSRGRFLKHHVKLKLKSCFFKKEFLDFFKLVFKYNFRIIR